MTKTSAQTAERGMKGEGMRRESAKKKQTKEIAPHLWYDKEAKEAARFYTSVFKDSKVNATVTLQNTPAGDVDFVEAEFAGQGFTLMSAGPLFKFNPSISFIVACDSKKEVDSIWGKLSKGGKTLMELGEYPFSERYGWTQDKYGLSWQVMVVKDHLMKQKITPVLMFAGDVYGRAEEAINLYTSIFQDSRTGEIHRYGKDSKPDREGAIMYAGFTINGQEFAAMDSAGPHEFKFNEAISFIVPCETQEEIDYYWGKLSADPEAEQCGWIKDRFGVSWQIVPTSMMQMWKSKDPKRVARVTEAFMKMKKINIETLKRAYEGV